jgi:hypothetical protein
MKKDFQLNIPTPCHENWADMLPEEKGRYCGACSKTVVDFSGMSDREIVQYLSRAGQQVCGRVAPEQLNRAIAVQPVAGKGWRVWWHWMLAGLLISSEATAQQRPKAADTVMVRMGRMSLKPTQVQAAAVKDSIKIKELPTVTVVGYPTIYCHRLTGAMTMVSVRTDTLKQWVSDTLSMLGMLPKKELAVYPNPVRKGMAVSLTWQGTEPGQYEVAMFSSSGTAVQRRVMEVASKEQVDLLEIPASLAGGMYFLQMTKAGGAKVVTRKLVVL